ncbi:hypothetical protein BDP81DRAFT_416221 [Colletotrichum phormii]|uniref:Uncharacterized protein n=1 Tax=Colletotrichum phormii TaxID=359342 RepID=A0AAJ0A1F7_9PEZI|nr:uncharacterized protein BDP81DRAFT_416221 [Colletotrichum phormii]KAK1654651.1 hypothetical protein BDP81DRAFT_416221 [Colletotrichum phormii]
MRVVMNIACMYELVDVIPSSRAALPKTMCGGMGRGRLRAGTGLSISNSGRKVYRGMG